MDVVSKVSYDYDAGYNRTEMDADGKEVYYAYDSNDRLSGDSYKDYQYDDNGNQISAEINDEQVSYTYTVDNKLEKVEYPDGTYVKYGYDAFGRKAYREEAYYTKSQSTTTIISGGSGNGQSDEGKTNNGNGNGSGKVKENNGKSDYAPGHNKEGITKTNIKNPLKMKTDITSYQYDGFSNDVLNEFVGKGSSPLSQYYTANGNVVAKKTFGNHGLVIPGREPSLKTNGGLMYYHYDGIHNVTELTSKHGDVIEQYRYDAFGGLFTGITAPYNTSSFTGMSYDPKANLLDLHSRWYAPQTGRFTSADTYRGDLLTPGSQNRYAYVSNNPINFWDPTGHWQEGDEGLSNESDKDAIHDLTDDWNNATTDAERDAAHEAAEEIRNRITTSTSESRIRSWTENGSKSYGTSWRDREIGGRFTNWTRIDTYYEEYRITETDRNAYGSVVSFSSSYRTDSTKRHHNGVDFRPFTAREWHSENKAILNDYKKPREYNPPKAYSRLDESRNGFTTSSYNTRSSYERERVRANYVQKQEQEYWKLEYETAHYGQRKSDVIAKAKELGADPDEYLEFVKGANTSPSTTGFVDGISGQNMYYHNDTIWSPDEKKAYDLFYDQGELAVTAVTAIALVGVMQREVTISQERQMLQDIARQNKANELLNQAYEISPETYRAVDVAINTGESIETVNKILQSGKEINAIAKVASETGGRFSGELVKVNKPDAGADALAKRLNGQSRVKFSNDPKGKEFDTISEKFIAETKPALQTYNKSVRNQMKAAFEAAQQTDRNVYYHFEGQPAQSVLDKLYEYSNRYKIDVVIDVKPLF